MIARHLAHIFVLCLVSLPLPASLYAQEVKQLAPLNLSFRAVATDWPGQGESLFVGDSGVCELFDHTTFWHPYIYIDKSATFLAAAYSGGLFCVAGTNGVAYYQDANNNNQWTKGNTFTTATLRAMSADPFGNFFVVGDSGLILESTDNGANWSRLVSPVTKQLNAIAFSSTGVYAVAVGNDSAIVVTTDDGQTWNTEPFPYHLDSVRSGLPPFNLDTVTAVNFSAVAMSPGGDSVWVGLEKPVLPLLLVNGKAVPAQKLIVFPNSGPLTSLVYYGDTGFYILGFSLDDMLYFVNRYGALSDNTLSYIGDADGTIDAAPSRVRCAAPYTPFNQSQGVDVAGDDFYITFINFFDSIHSIHGTQEAKLGSEFPGILLDQDVQSSGKGFGVEVGGVVLYTTDSGQSFISITGDTTWRLNSVWCSSNSDIAIAIGWNGLIVRREDTDISDTTQKFWMTIPSGTQERLHGIAFPTVETGIIVGDYGTVLRSSDTGKTWNPITLPTQQYLRSVAFTTSEIGVATGDSATIFRTTDRGSTWIVVNHFLTGTDTSIQKVQAFPDGTFLAQADGLLIRSNDSGKDWETVPSPGDSIGMSFYSTRIGIIGQRATSSAIVPDTAYMWYTTDGGNAWNPVVVPIWNDHRILIHWLNDHQAILYGIEGFEDEVTFSSSGVTVAQLSNDNGVHVYPNPTTGDFHIDYITQTTGRVTIQLFSEGGENMGTLFSGTVSAGTHSQMQRVPDNLHGTFFLRVVKDNRASTEKISVP